MGSLFRSEEMRLCQVFLQQESAYHCVSELGEIGCVQFKDLNENVNAFQRKFVNEVRRCEEMERKLRYMEKELHKDGIAIPDTGLNPKAPIPKEMIDLEVTFEKMDKELREVNTNYEALKQNSLELNEMKEVLMRTQNYFAANQQDLRSVMEEDLINEEANIGARGTASAGLGFMVGTVLREKVHVFERVISMVTHGNVFVRTEEISQELEDPHTGDMMKKNMFIILFQGDQLRNKVKKVCEGLRANVYPMSDSAQERQEMLKGVQSRLIDLGQILSQTRSHRERILDSAQKEMRSWTIKVEKIKAIFHTLNMLKVYQNQLIAECWCPVKAFDDIRGALTTGEKISGSDVVTVIHPMNTNETPPTYYNCNKFVKGFQNIVDSYGVASYGEVNPAPYTCITFPFLFAVMFGDLGHGFLMFIFGAWMCLWEKSLAKKKISNEIWNTFFGGRYIIMMMGLFSVYTGFIYNDCFSRSFNIFGSQWEPVVKEQDWGAESIELDPVTSHINKTAYLIGVDPIWQSAKNKILFLNSLKMKMAIILGVTHMIFGICLSVFNHVHFRRPLDIFVGFIPELLFLGCLFGYLVALVFYKWVSFDATDAYCAPALLIHYINMFMFKYNTFEQLTPTTSNCAQVPFYDGQKTVQTILFLLAVLSVPVLLLVKPIYLICKLKKKRRADMYAAQSTDPLIDNEVLPGNPRNPANSVGNPGNPDNQGALELGQVNPAYQQENAVNGRPLDGPSQMYSVNSDEEESPEPKVVDTAKSEDAESHGQVLIVIEAIPEEEESLGNTTDIREVEENKCSDGEVKDENEKKPVEEGGDNMNHANHVTIPVDWRRRVPQIEGTPHAVAESPGAAAGPEQEDGASRQTPPAAGDEEEEDVNVANALASIAAAASDRMVATHTAARGEADQTATSPPAPAGVKTPLVPANMKSKSPAVKPTTARESDFMAQLFESEDEEEVGKWKRKKAATQEVNYSIQAKAFYSDVTSLTDVLLEDVEDYVEVSFNDTFEELHMEDASDARPGAHGDEVGEIVIHQAIHTIEFCLGCISHTASYLRLWALSLAHAQLSEVLWTLVLHIGFTVGGKYVGSIGIFIIFFFWANLTVAILLLMEGLSAFLHTLRLHWVEFMSKFYKGEGHAFMPFNFDHIINMSSLEEATA